MGFRVSGIGYRVTTHQQCPGLGLRSFEPRGRTTASSTHSRPQQASSILKQGKSKIRCHPPMALRMASRTSFFMTSRWLEGLDSLGLGRQGFSVCVPSALPRRVPTPPGFFGVEFGIDGGGGLGASV